MKSKQLNKFLLMFFLSFTLFFSVSYAAWSEIPNTTQAHSESLGEADTIAGYTLNQIRGFFKSDVSDRNKMLEAVKSAGYYVLWVPIKNDLSSYYTYVFPISSSVDFGGYTDGLDTSTFFFYTYIEEGYQFYIRNNITSSKASKRTCTQSGHIVIGGTNSFKATTFNTLIAEDPLKFGNLPYLKKLSSNSGYYWDGTSYYWEGSSEPEIPFVDYDLASIVDIIKKSTEVQDNIYPYLEEYFIVPNGTANNEEVFSVYFYYPSVNLSQFEYSYNDVLYYDLDKISIDGLISNLTYYLGGNTSSNVVKDVQLATLYYDPDTGTGDVYFTANRTLDQLKSFNSTTQPIIYTTKDIAYYSATWGETDTEWTAVPDENKNILTEVITDSEGNIIDPVLPGSSSVLLGDTPLERFVNVIQTALLGLGDSISKGLISFTDYLLNLFGENVVTFIFLIVIKAITILVSSVALIFRFISFIMTLVAIPASSSLLAVDVASNSSGLVFTGLNWGTYFINGLNFIKSVQWNGLGLWTLFEVFVASLEVVLFVKIVRKHYRTL